MGTDIHLVLQYRDAVNYNRPDDFIQRLRREGEDLRPYTIYGDWKLGGLSYDLEESGLEHIYQHVIAEDWVDTYRVYSPDRIMFTSERNYELFHWLTGTVRSYRPISTEPLYNKPRGWPDDYDDKNSDDTAGCHSCSWVDVRELLSCPYETQWEEAARNWSDKDARLIFWFDN